MTYENTIRNSLLTYGTIFPSEWHVAEHMFCVIGNGWHWENGQVVSDDYNKKKQVLTFKELLDNDKPNSYELQKLHNYKNNITQVFDERDILVSMRNDLIRNQSAIMNYEFGNYFVPDFSICAELPTVYDTSEYSLINNIPSDIKPDWINGLHKFICFCLKNKSLIEKKNTVKDFEKAKEHLETNHRKYCSSKFIV